MINRQIIICRPQSLFLLKFEAFGTGILWLIPLWTLIKFNQTSSYTGY